jgi:hypothetical protein
VTNYERLIFLAREIEMESTPQKILELNRLLSDQDFNEVKDGDLQILYELISILSNTDNLLAENMESIVNLQDKIRSRRYQ